MSETATLDLTDALIQASDDINRARREVQLVVGMISKETLRLTADDLIERWFEGRAGVWRYQRLYNSLEFHCHMYGLDGRRLGLSTFAYRSNFGIRWFGACATRSVRRALPTLMNGMIGQVAGLETAVRDFIKNS